MRRYPHLATLDLGLRPYQQKLAAEAVADIRDGYSTCIVLATGGGKSRTMAEVVRQVLTEELFSRVLIPCHSVEILHQLYKELARLKLPIGWIAAEDKARSHVAMNAMAPVQLVSTACAARRSKDKKYAGVFKKLLAADSLVLFDEVHRAGSGATGALFWDSDAKVSGFTATPWSKWMTGRFDSLVSGPLPGELMDRGYLVYPRYVEDETMSDRGLAVSGGDYSPSAISKLMRDSENFTQKALRFVFEACPEGQLIFFVADSLHATAVQNILVSLGKKSEIILADTEGRDTALARIEKQPDVHGISIDVLSTGIDIPKLAGIVMLRHTMSPIVFFQQLGRALRTFPGKEYAWVFDFVGNIARHVRPEELSEYIFEGARKKGTREIAQKECPGCGVYNGALRLRCYACGHLFEDQCPGCGADLFLSQSVCRSCGFDRRTADEKAAADAAALEKLKQLQSCFENNLIDSAAGFRYTYQNMVLDGWEGVARPDAPLLWIQSNLRQGIGLERLTEHTAYTLFDKETVTLSRESCYRAYAEHLIRWRSPSGEFIKDVQIAALMSLQFGHEGRQFLSNFSPEALTRAKIVELFGRRKRGRK